MPQPRVDKAEKQAPLKPASTALTSNVAPRNRAKAPPPPDLAASSATPLGAAAALDSAADLVDTQLARYRGMRDFDVTAEPSGESDTVAKKAVARTQPAKPKAAAGLPFVIQKHAASHLHYDFRLGWSGVLKSWAVAKGPSFFPGDRRLAVQVEDHPMEYGGFEGIIPKGQYGGGTVMVWDQGTWWPQPGHENVDAGLRTGSLKFEMHGSKMQGKWTLVRMHTTKPASGSNGRWRSSDKPQWLLIKEHDEYERSQTAPCITEEAPDSALTDRTMDEIAHQEDHVWNSKETAGTGQAWYRQETYPREIDPQESAPQDNVPPDSAPAEAAADTTPARSDATSKPAAALRIAPRRPAKQTPTLPPSPLAARLEDLPKEPQPEFLQPELAQEAEAPPEGSGWLHELKLDGYRMQARKHGREVQMLTRSGLDWTYRVQGVADAVAQLPVGDVTLDGEVVVLAEDGTTSFAALQASFQQGEAHPLTFFCFDLLHLQGHNTRNLPLQERKALLAAVLPKDDTGLVRLSEHLEANGNAMFQQACRLHAEGIISKRADAPYRAGRTADWRKAKCLHEQEFVIGGFSPSSDGPDRIGSLLLGYYEPAKAGKGGSASRLVYAGRTGTGFTQKMRRDLRAQLARLETRTPPFATVPAEARRGGSLWVKPELVAQVRFATWTAENFVRQAAFLGLREDKRPAEVFREEPTVAPQPKSPRATGRPPEEGRGRTAATQKQSPNIAARLAPTLAAPTLAAPTLAAPTLGAPSLGAPSSPAAISPVRVGTRRPAPPTPASIQASTAPVRLTHPKKILDPESQLTKQQLADFYWAVAERMLPHVADRPLSLVRCPDGASQPCFYQKHVNHMLPPGVGSVLVADKKSGVPEPYITLNTPEALAGLAQMGVLEIHPWGSRNESLECPDRIIFDLDPDEGLPWSIVTAAALEVRARLKKAGLESFLKTTGGKGLHIVAPILPAFDFATVKDAAHQFVIAMERNHPALYLTKMTKAARKGKIYLDYLRNERGATAVAPFSPRARLGVHASVTLEWKELNDGDRPVFPVHDFAAWQDRLRRDPWKRMLTLQQHLDPTRMRAR